MGLIHWRDSSSLVKKSRLTGTVAAFQDGREWNESPAKRDGDLPRDSSPKRPTSPDPERASIFAVLGRKSAERLPESHELSKLPYQAIPGFDNANQEVIGLMETRKHQL